MSINEIIRMAMLFLTVIAFTCFITLFLWMQFLALKVRKHFRNNYNENWEEINELFSCYSLKQLSISEVKSKMKTQLKFHELLESSCLPDGDLYARALIMKIVALEKASKRVLCVAASFLFLLIIICIAY